MAENEQPDESQKTEEPTAKRLEESRKKGQVALSREVNNWVMLCAATLMIATIADPVLGRLNHLMQVFIAQAEQLSATPDGIGAVLGQTTWQVFFILAFPLLGLMVVAALSPFVQIGPLFAPESIKPDISKISPIKGFSRLFSMRSLMEFVKGILKLSVISVVGILIIYPYFDRFEHFIGMPMDLLMEELKLLVVQIMVGILVALLVIAVIDLAYQRYEHAKKMRMTKQEVKDEYKQSEGDPHVKARLRQLRSEKGRQRMMQNVPDADVVITNPTHYSIALKYDPDTMAAPQCLAKGVDDLALRIRELAKENKIVLFENKPLARALFDTVEIDEFVPPEHYQAVAEVISYVFKLKGKLH